MDRVVFRRTSLRDEFSFATKKNVYGIKRNYKDEAAHQIPKPDFVNKVNISKQQVDKTAYLKSEVRKMVSRWRKLSSAEYIQVLLIN